LRAWIEQALTGSPYSVTAIAAVAMSSALSEIDDRVSALRADGKLTPETLRRYYGMKRYEQVAESNAIEGSTLSIGETELAVAKGMTLTGHDPGYVRDAIALDKALIRLTEMAREDHPTDIPQIKELHELIMAGRNTAGDFRTGPVRIAGSEHRPPKTWDAIVSGMEDLEKWSITNTRASPILRASLLHAWLVHIHPFADGNGRTARAVSNLELVRAGFPPIVIRRTQDKERYIDALQNSDSAGDIGPFLDLILDRAKAAFVGLEGAAREKQGYDAVSAVLRQAQGRQREVWNKSVELLFQILVDQLATALESAGGRLESRVIQDALALDDYLELAAGRPVSKSWAFKFRARAPSLTSVERLAWVGYRSRELRNAMGPKGVPAPSLYWSQPNPDIYPPWTKCTPDDAPRLTELSITPGQGDDWHVLTAGGKHLALATSEVARQIAAGVADLIARQQPPPP
jgi:Fic family protein